MSTSTTLTTTAAAPTPGTTQVSPPPAAPGAANVASQVASGPTGGVTATTTTTETVNPGAWMAGMNEDMRGFLGNKGFKGPQDLADSYRNLEKLRGVPQERLLTVPEKFRNDDGTLTPEGRAVFERVGAPKDAKDYQIEIPAEMGDPKMADYFRQKFFEMGMPAEMAQATVNNWNGYMKEAMVQQQQAAADAFKAQDGKLKTEWGAAYEQNTNVAREAVRNMGMDAKQIDALSGALGHEGAMKLLVKLGKATAEGSFLSSNPGNNGPLEPANAMQQIKALSNDATFRQKLASGDAEAVGKWTRLHQMATPGEQTLGAAPRR